MNKNRGLTRKLWSHHSANFIVINLGIMTFNPLMGVCLDQSGHNYRLTYFAASAISILALV